MRKRPMDRLQRWKCARDAVRTFRAKVNPGQTVTVQLRGGVYTRTEPLIFRPEDSGPLGGSVTYESYPGELAVVSGGRVISGWKPAGKGLWKADLPEVRAGKWSFRQLFVNG